MLLTNLAMPILRKSLINNKENLLINKTMKEKSEQRKIDLGKNKCLIYK